MPIYDYECTMCGLVEDVWARINEERMIHGDCGNTMKRVLSPTRVNPDYKPWVDENLCGQMGENVVVKSRRHQKQLLKERGLHIRS